MGKKRGPYSSLRQQDRRTRILRVAGNLLEEHGLAALTMQSIAEVSEVSVKTLYNLFGNRELLLLEAAAERLVDLERSDFVTQAEPGIPRLLAFMTGAMRQFEEMPQYARVVIAILLRADLDYDAAYARFGLGQRFAHASLRIAAEKGELREDLDLVATSYLLASNQWGAVLLWEKGLLALEQLAIQVDIGHHLTLMPLCRGKRKQALETSLAELLGRVTTLAQTSGSPSLEQQQLTNRQ